MLDITAANTRNLPTVAKPPGPKTYRKREDAKFAAIRALGPEARHEFEFTTEKCDGRWLWRATDPDKVPPDTAAEIKANGGKKGARLPQCTECGGTWRHMNTCSMARQAPEKASHASEPKGAVLTPPTSANAPAKPVGAGLAALAVQAGWQSSVPTVRTVGDAVAEAIDAGVEPGHVAANLAGLGSDPLDVPDFLLRKKNGIQADPKRPSNPPAKPRKVPDGGRRLTEKEITEIAEGPNTHQRRKSKDKKPKTKAPHGVVVGETVAPAPKAKLDKGPSKTSIIAALLTRKEGCTTADILTATGWPSVSVPAMAKAAGLTLTKTKDGSVTRYHGS